MDRFASREDLAAKIEWEGGVLESLGYGIKSGAMPEGDTELETAWKALEDSFRQTTDLADEVRALLPDEF